MSINPLDCFCTISFTDNRDFDCPWIHQGTVRFAPNAIDKVIKIVAQYFGVEEDSSGVDKVKFYFDSIPQGFKLTREDPHFTAMIQIHRDKDEFCPYTVDSERITSDCSCTISFEDSSDPDCVWTHQAITRLTPNAIHKVITVMAEYIGAEDPSDIAMLSACFCAPCPRPKYFELTRTNPDFIAKIEISRDAARLYAAREPKPYVLDKDKPWKLFCEKKELELYDTYVDNGKRITKIGYTDESPMNWDLFDISYKDLQAGQGQQKDRYGQLIPIDHVARALFNSASFISVAEHHCDEACRSRTLTKIPLNL